jgi:ankyrin repeat protein
MNKKSSIPGTEVIDLFVNSSHGDFPKVKELLNLYPEIINCKSSAQETALGAAAHTGQKAIAEFLLEAGAPLDICTAAMLNREDEVQKMLKGDPSLSAARGSHGIPVMYYAAFSGSVEIAEMLLKKGADVNGGDGVITPLHGAIIANKEEMVEWLLAQGASVEAKDYSGRNAHDFAVASKREGLAEKIRKSTAGTVLA